jgi:hypothetical protein
MLVREIITESWKKYPLYHISNDPDLKINASHDLRQGVLGRGFYVTGEPRVWKDGGLGGKRNYTYKVFTNNLKVATDKPSAAQLNKWAIEKGYMKMAPVIRPSGEQVLDLDNKPMIRPDITELGKQFIWRDPVTGKSMNDLENKYLSDHGFNAYEAQYSPEGHQIIIFDPSIVKLKRIS